MLYIFGLQALLSILRASSNSNSVLGSNLIPVQEVGSSHLYTGHVYTIWLPKQDPSDIEVGLRIDQGRLVWVYSESDRKGWAPDFFTFLPVTFNGGNQLACLKPTDASLFPFKVAKGAVWTDNSQDVVYGLSDVPDAWAPLNPKLWPTQPDFWAPVRSTFTPGLHKMMRQSPTTGSEQEYFATYGTLLVSTNTPQDLYNEFVQSQDEIIKQKGLNIKLKLNPHVRFVIANYSMEATIVDFTYPGDMADILKNQSAPLSLATKQNFVNNSPGTITQKYKASKTKENTFTYGFTEGIKITTSVKTEAGVPLVDEGEVTVSGTISLDSNQQWTTTSSETYSVETEITVPPFTSIEAMSYVNWVTNMKIPYTATLEIRMSTMRVTKDLDMAIVPMELDALKQNLQDQAPDLVILGVTKDAVLVKSSGEIVGAMGLDTFIIMKNTTLPKPF